MWAVCRPMFAVLMATFALAITETGEVQIGGKHRPSPSRIALLAALVTGLASIQVTEGVPTQGSRGSEVEGVAASARIATREREGSLGAHHFEVDLEDEEDLDDFCVAEGHDDDDDDLLEDLFNEDHESDGDPSILQGFSGQRRNDRNYGVVGADIRDNAPDIYVAATVDGVLHGTSLYGEPFWSSEAVGGPTVRSYQSDLSFKQGAAIVGEDGLLYLFSETEGLALHHLSIPDLVNACPFTDTLGDSEIKVRVVGERKTSFYELDPNTGKRLRVFTSDSGSLLHGRWAKPTERSGEEPESRQYSSKRPYDGAPPLTIGRVDYRVRAFDASTGDELWNFTYGEFTSNEKDVAHLDGDSLDVTRPGVDVPERFTIGGIPVTSIFGAGRSNAQGRSSWKYVSSQTISSTGRERITNFAETPTMYLQRIVFRDGTEQVYATTAKVGRPLRCSANFPGESGSVVPFLPPDELNPEVREPCMSNRMDDDFPLQGPYRVTNQIHQFKTRPSHGLALPEPRETNQPDRIVMVPPKEIALTKHTDVRNLQIAVVILLAFLSYFMSQSFVRRKSERAPELRECVFDKESNSERVGDLTVILNSESILGRGCAGTTVYKGSLRGRPVAVKKVLSSQFKLAQKEIDLLIRSDEHPNIVRYFHTESTRDFIFLALELCDCSLEQAVSSVQAINKERKQRAPKSSRKNLRIPTGTISFLRDLASATNHLHELRIIHCDIKPANILVVSRVEGALDIAAAESTETSLVGIGDIFDAKLSDMGLGRKFVGNTSSVYGGTSMQGSGTIGWRAPELLTALTSKKSSKIDEHDVAVRLGRKVDVFSLGCVFFYVITGGFHPFGDHLDRERNIQEYDPVNLSRIKHFPLAHDLITQMVKLLPDERPSMEEVLLHPLLWEPETKLEFLKHVSDRLEADRANESLAGPRAFSVSDSGFQEHLEKHAEEVVGPQGWLQRLHPVLRHDVVESKRRYYATHSLRDLLRYIRNRLSHFRELDEPVRELLTPMPTAFLHQFLGSNRFPTLLLVCYNFILETCAHESEFRPFLKETADKYSPASLEWQERVSRQEEEDMKRATNHTMSHDRHEELPSDGPASPKACSRRRLNSRGATRDALGSFVRSRSDGPKGSPSLSPHNRPARSSPLATSIKPPPGFDSPLGEALPPAAAVPPPPGFEQLPRSTSSPSPPEKMKFPSFSSSPERSDMMENWRSLGNPMDPPDGSPSSPGGRFSLSSSPPSSSKMRVPKTGIMNRASRLTPNDPLYKTKMCRDGDLCTRGESCFFAHGYDELRRADRQSAMFSNRPHAAHSS